MESPSNNREQHQSATTNKNSADHFSRPPSPRTLLFSAQNNVVSKESPKEAMALTRPESPIAQQDDVLENLPYHRELLDKMRSTECQLCKVEFSSPIMSKMHYVGKKHLKKVNRWHLENLNNGKLITRLDDQQIASSDTKPEYCEYCDVQMLTPQEKIIHVYGKKHLRNINSPYKIKRSLKQRGAEDGDKALVQSCSPLRCDLCKMEFENERSMEEHKRTLKHNIGLLNQEDGDPITPGKEHWFCMMCKRQFKNITVYNAHLFEEKHLTLEMNCGSLLNKIFYCTVCNIHMPNEDKDEHESGLEHMRKDLLNSTIDLIKEMANEDDLTLVYRCPYCADAGLMNFITFNNHMLSDAHIDKVLGDSVLIGFLGC